jgi:hypothetical protein
MTTNEPEPIDLSPFAACSLPAADRPGRQAAFDALFATAVRNVERAGPDRLRLALAPTPEVAAQTAALVTRETACCSFFTFTITASAGELVLDVAVPASQREALDALAARAAR